ncbi:E3 ubiquitin-protein ligase RZFP34 isoform X2 [Gossypium hirsutum]|uniref:E3 ubiquitin-protein ligase RZFP34 isoform X2 n=1 Tax=Gossypium hirsutum TaxID=3635 RepID=A0ABM3B673_GOSHI|nr:E3 ubiquitin-protein ligase RZFP34 isoform X2 [Gossypium hirsutum]XP_040962551.1 E3 ubiquitin-protein ligase RZFP34 isoform X2 [Gossypium hirsutum]
MGVHIIEEDVRSEHLVAMRFFIADIAIMNLRIPRNLVLLSSMTFHAMKLKRSSAPYVTQNKMYNSIASIVESVWGSTSVVNVNSLMMITGGKENFFHCNKCGCCYSNLMREVHRCIEKAMHHDCPICFEFLFDTMKDVTVLPCGHTMHLGCLREMEEHYRYSCPVCSKSICDMSKLWRKLDKEIASTPMPAVYQNKMVWILCNDCGATSNVQFHIVAHKCPSCESYNTRQTRGGAVGGSCSEMVR